MSIYSKKLYYVSIQCGGGKTHLIIKTINANPSKNYIVVVPSKQLQLQYYNSLGFGLIMNHETHENLLESISKELIQRNERVLFITDKMFYRIQPQLLKPWSVFVDDCVDYFGFQSDVIDSSDELFKGALLPAYLYANVFNITSISDDENYVNVTLNNDVRSDVLVRIKQRYERFQYYHQIVINSTAFSDDNCRRLFIIGYYDLEQYVNNGVEIVYFANAFESTLIYKKYSHLFEEYKHDLVPNDTNNQRLTVKYFAKNNALSSTRLKAERDKTNNMMSSIGEYINANENVPVLWTCNEAYKRYWNITGEYITPCQRGMNHLQHHTVAACMVSMKVDDAMAKHIEAVLGHTYGEIVHQYEYEAINQFVYRTNLRNYQSNSGVTLYVFDENQAYSIEGAGSYEYIDVGIDAVLNRAGRPGSELPAKVRDAARKWIRTKERTMIEITKYVNKMTDKYSLDEGQKTRLIDKLKHETKGA
ncbi:DEAD/DEAH box helicase family protein [Enterobacter sp.]|uniref:DEAD/DEAH box helicase family protein n=1 Tax=Enterobacter sp. TaxID=42895 RepID=UPI00296FB498|nr:DEAD/DEAH box helicase family protein [Enterobacter sp.]